MDRTKNILLYIYITLIIFPFIYLVLLSFSSEWRFPFILPDYFGVRNWSEVLSGASGLMSSFFLSLFISLSVAVTSTMAGFFISRYVSYHPKKHLWTLLTYFPYILAPVVFAACLSFFFLRLQEKF